MEMQMEIRAIVKEEKLKRKQLKIENETQIEKYWKKRRQKTKKETGRNAGVQQRITKMGKNRTKKRKLVTGNKDRELKNGNGEKGKGKSKLMRAL